LGRDVDGTAYVDESEYGRKSESWEEGAREKQATMWG